MNELINDNIIIKKINGIEIIQFKRLLELGIKHGYTLKNEELNFRSNSEEEIDSYKKVFDCLELDFNTLVKPLQKHTNVVRCIDKVVEKKDLKEVDGLITDQKNISLVTTNADCILFLFYDPEKQVIANVHSGWKGTFQKIAEKALIKMITCYGCNPENIEIFICPSIRVCHFEVDEDVKLLCEEIFGFTEKTKEFIKLGELKRGTQKYMIDTVKINKILFLENGIKEENIYDCEICSVCHSDKIRSYRAEGKDFKLATSVISL